MRRKGDRQSRVGQSLREFSAELRLGVRALGRTPGFTSVVVLILALGIGTNIAIFSLIRTLILQPLPVDSPEQLVELLSVYPGDPRVNSFSRATYAHFRDRNTVFSHMTGVSAFTRFEVTHTNSGPEAVNGQRALGNFFETLGVEAALGRLPGSLDEQSGSSRTAVLSWRYWRTRFNQDPTILGETLLVDGGPAIVVGVAPRGFEGIQKGFRTDIWLPLPATDQGNLGLIGRLKPGASIEQAEAEMRVLDRWRVDQWRRESSDPLVAEVRLDVDAASAGLGQLRERFARPLLILIAVAGLLLAIATANVAAMMLARATARRRDMAVRASLGAGPGRILRLVFGEAMLLALAGGGLGLLLAHTGAKTLARILASGRPMVGWPVPVDLPIQFDPQVWILTLSGTLLVGLLSAIGPAWAAWTTSTSTLRTNDRAGETKSSRTAAKSFVVAQIAFSMVLTSVASLLIGHLWMLRHADLGFEPGSVLLVTLKPEQSERSRLFGPYRGLLERIGSLPAVHAASLAGPTPISGAAASRFVHVEGIRQAPEDRRRVSLSWVSPGYFRTLSIPFLQGSDFEFRSGNQPRTVIVNQAMAMSYFTEEAPIGRHIGFEGIDEPFTIVGVVGDAKYSDLHVPAPPTVYIHAFQETAMPANQLVVRMQGRAAAVAGTLRLAIAETLPNIPIAGVRTLEDQVNASIVPERLIAISSGILGGMGALLAAIGLYALLAYRVEQRRSEIGIRLALGATRTDIARMVTGNALRIVSLGIVIAVPVAFFSEALIVRVVGNAQLRIAIPMAT